MLFGRSGGISWLVVGLGNPGTQYESTRHNMGFLAVDKLAQEENFRFSKLRFKAWTATWEVGGQKVLVMKPQTYMNLSGESVGEAARFYKIPPEHVLVISDDIDLPAGRLRIRRALGGRPQRPEEYHPAPRQRQVPPASRWASARRSRRASRSSTG